MSVFQFPLIWLNWIVVKWLLLLFTVYFLQQLSWRSCVWLGANNPIDIMCRQNRRYLWTCKYLISCARKYLWKLRQRQWNALVEIGHAAQAWGGDGERSFFCLTCPVFAPYMHNFSSTSLVFAPHAHYLLFYMTSLSTKLPLFSLDYLTLLACLYPCRAPDKSAWH